MSKQTSTQPLSLGRKSLEQSISDNIRIILTTSPGDVPYRPRFGFGVEEVLDGNIDDLDLASEVTSKISEYEKRIRVKQVISNRVAAGVRSVKIIYTILKTNTLQQITIE
ncbi:MAG: GPW/gp25 family protein [Rikenellaceae bacterium]